MAWTKTGFAYDTSVMHAPDQIVSIGQLSSDLVNPVIIGMVIAKQDPRGVQNKKQPGPERFVLNFTIRGSPTDTLNIACWGEESVIRRINSTFMIGNIVKIKNAQIVKKQDDGSDDRFRPRTTSEYQLNISPLYSEIIVCDEHYVQLFHLLHYPIHSSSDFVALAEIILNGKAMEGLCVNLLVAVRDMGTIQDVKAKDGRTLKKFQFIVFDHTHPVFPVLIWEEETSRFILKSCQKTSILMISDIRLSYNDFLKGMIATASSSTVFTPDPAIVEAEDLAEYVRTAAKHESSSLSDNKKSSSILSVYTIEEVENMRNPSELSAFEDTEGYIYAYLSAFDLDGHTRLTSLKCSKCQQIIRSPQTQCSNGSCEVGTRALMAASEEYFDIPVCLSDCTGTLVRCAFSGPPVEKILNMTVEQFKKLSDQEKTDLKWLFLFEKFEFRFKIPQSSVATGNITIHITSCEKITEDDRIHGK